MNNRHRIIPVEVRSRRCCTLRRSHWRAGDVATRDSRSATSGSAGDRLGERTICGRCTRGTRCLRGRFAERGFIVEGAPRAANSGSFALPVRIGTGGRGVRMDAGSRLDRQRVLTQRGDDPAVRYSPQKIRFPQFRPICRGKQIWRCGSHWSCNRSTSQLPYRTRKSIRVATNTPGFAVVVVAAAGRLRHARSLLLSCRRTPTCLDRQPDEVITTIAVSKGRTEDRRSAVTRARDPKILLRWIARGSVSPPI